MKESDFVRIINNSIKVFEFSWTGKLVSINKWHTLIKIKGKYFIGVSYDYKKLKKKLIETINKQKDKNVGLYYNKIHPIENRVDMIINVSRWRVSDTGNIEKPIGDALEVGRGKNKGAGIILNDRQIRHIFIFRDYHKKGEDDILRVRLFLTGEEM